MHPVHIDLAFFDAAPGVLQVDLALAHRLHFGAEEFDAGFETFENKVIVVCLFVSRDGLKTVVFFLGHQISLLPSMARARVVSSAYSRVAPTGTP